MPMGSDWPEASIAGAHGQEDIVNAGERLIEQGRAEGLERGRTEGRAEGLRTAIATALVARSVALSEAGRARIASCSDIGEAGRVRIASCSDLDTLTRTGRDGRLRGRGVRERRHAVKAPGLTVEARRDLQRHLLSPAPPPRSRSSLQPDAGDSERRSHRT